MKLINKIYVRLITALLPFLFFPLIVDSFGFGKLWVMGALVMLGLLMWTITGVTKKNSLRVRWSPILTGVLLWTIWSIVSYFYMPVGLKMKSLLSVGGIGSVLVILGMVFLWTQNSNEEEDTKQLNWLTVSGVLVAITSLVIFLIPQSKLPILLPKSNPMLAIDQNWSLVGSVLSEMVFLLVLAGVWVKNMVSKIKDKQDYIMSAILVSV